MAIQFCCLLYGNHGISNILYVKITPLGAFDNSKQFNHKWNDFCPFFQVEICSEFYLALKCVYVIWMVGGKNKIPVLYICVYCKQPLLSFRYQSYSVMFTVTLQQEIIISFDRKSFVLILAEFFFPMHLSQIVTKKEIKGYLLFVRGGRYHNVIYSDICNKRI